MVAMLKRPRSLDFGDRLRQALERHGERCQPMDSPPIARPKSQAAQITTAPDGAEGVPIFDSLLADDWHDAARREWVRERAAQLAVAMVRSGREIPEPEHVADWVVQLAGAIYDAADDFD